MTTPSAASTDKKKKKPASTKVSTKRATTAKKTKGASTATASAETSAMSFGEGYAPMVNIGAYLPKDLFLPSSCIPSISVADFEKHKETIEGQRRSVELMQQNLGLVLDLQKAEGIQIDGAIEQQKNQVKLGKLGEQRVLTEIQTAKVDFQRIALTEQSRRNEIKAADVEFAEIELEGARTRNDIAQLENDQLAIDRDGQEQMVELHQQTWDLKLEGIRVDLKNATNQLEQKRQMLSAQTLGH